MLFNSYEYILALLPVSFFGYFLLNKKKLTIASKAWLVFASLFFYSWWNIKYLPLILASILFNFAVGSTLAKRDPGLAASRKAILGVGVAGNLGLLGYYKYADFFIDNYNALSGGEAGFLHLALPLGISFFTFTQIAYLVDSYKGQTSEYDLLNYSLFVTFFPHLLAGPIIHHKEMMPQFDSLRNKPVNFKKISTGLYIFFVGLFKKMVIADTFAVWANAGFDTASALTFIEGWVTSLSYTFQIYFDFSGYTDMAIGSALLFNIILPLNFNSPYKAADIRDFWRRWHITLSRFLRDYIYIPLGGNRRGEPRTYLNLLVTFLIGGLWHGAGWMFLLWGLLHGAALVIHRAWEKTGIKMHYVIGWFLTFNFVCVTWVFFRAKDWSDASRVLKAMFGMSGFVLPEFLTGTFGFLEDFRLGPDGLLYHIQTRSFIPLCAALAAVVFLRNSNYILRDFRPSWRTLAFGAGIAAYSIINLDNITEFLYFNF